MAEHKWLPFIIMITAFISIIEIYVLFHWTKFIKRNGYSKFLYIIPWGLSAIMLLASFYLNYDRLYSSEIQIRNNLFLIFTSLIYLPKILIIPFLLTTDLVTLFTKIIKKIIRKNDNTEHPKNETNVARREVVSKIGWSLAIVPFGMGAYGFLRNTIQPQVHNVYLELIRFPENIQNFKIVQISDIHAGSYFSPRQFAEIRYIVNSLDPDIIVITGDFVNFKYEELNVIEQELRRLRANYGVFGCMGNHDHYVGSDMLAKFIDKLQEVGVKMLINENHIINTGEGIVQLAGVDNTGMSGQDFADFDKAINGLDESNSIIMLCHDPTNWEKSVVGQRNIDLMLSGHTHGGQFAANIFGRSISPASLVYKHYAGLYHQKEHYLYVNRGVGMTGPPFRVGVNPEITVFRIKKASNLV